MLIVRLYFEVFLFNYLSKYYDDSRQNNENLFKFVQIFPECCWFLFPGHGVHTASSTLRYVTAVTVCMEDPSRWTAG